jgi:nitrate/TMAO reductase-like tetraheme cytochrome c subunit
MKLLRLLTFSALLGFGLSAHSDEGARGSRAPAPAQYVQECGSCHVPYPARMLPAESWKRVMAQLSRHFGTDASLDAAAGGAVSGWLAAHAGSSGRTVKAPPDDRITRADWFVREHDEVGSAVWKRPAVKSPANCGACHARAAQGDFNEEQIHVPR